MNRRIIHIAILLLLGVYYNGSAGLWLAYSTFAKPFFIERCENPTKACCKGSCQVRNIEDHSGASEHSASAIQVAPVQPMNISTYHLSEPILRPEALFHQQTAIAFFDPIDAQLRPPRV